MVVAIPLATDNLCNQPGQGAASAASRQQAEMQTAGAARARSPRLPRVDLGGGGCRGGWLATASMTK